MTELNLLQETEGQLNKPKSKLGLAAFGLVAGCTVGLCVVTAPFLSPALRKICLPYVPATDAQVKNVIKALHHPPKLGRTLVDIGSGDGRIVFKAAKYGFHSTGYELNPWLVLYSIMQSWKNGLSYNAKFQRMDLWKVDYSNFDNVVIFGVEEMMPTLEIKLLKEMRPGSKIVACRFPLPNTAITSSHGEGADTVWTYDITGSSENG
ncbi:ATP synthase subunit C lysine N-methyltransferase-like [Clavelina lepadiformis]|uniref:ATP synthase subunit C lysine N-methyltransferase-like n=1 Tax=Clavelina lepadiformis TaxID=159417 RepID=UPI0040434696